jgi:hypothetical protein
MSQLKAIGSGLIDPSFCCCGTFISPHHLPDGVNLVSSAPR